jgi:LysR family transcriptional regulator, glycine cleavage system transcriptional activator
LSVSLPTTFGSRWLIPRLARFLERHPEIAVSLHTEGRGIDVPLAGTDLAIRMASAPKAGGTWLRLIRESYVPVCSPAIASRLEGQPADKIFELAPLIHLPTVVEDWHWWFKETGIRPPRGNQHLRFDTIRLAMSAATQGIAIGRKPLVDDDIANGRLVEIGGPARQGTTCYWLIGEEATFKRSEAKLFRSWLIDEMQGANPKLSGSRSAQA